MNPNISYALKATVATLAAILVFFTAIIAGCEKAPDAEHQAVVISSARIAAAEDDINSQASEFQRFREHVDTQLRGIELDIRTQRQDINAFATPACKCRDNECHCCRCPRPPRPGETEAEAEELPTPKPQVKPASKPSCSPFKVLPNYKK